MPPLTRHGVSWEQVDLKMALGFGPAMRGSLSGRRSKMRDTYGVVVRRSSKLRVRVRAEAHPLAFVRQYGEQSR